MFVCMKTGLEPEEVGCCIRSLIRCIGGQMQHVMIDD
jgi:hypothetical protein